ncbi:NB-ARC domain-containing protein (plasmid) [Streptosporangium sp. CA-135522]|uniref:NB-ARC domain-containing protein n=1 Tax=Streptosporangium sp. CA-135522 TaxID=3240072 RepID=UPI003D8F456C
MGMMVGPGGSGERRTREARNELSGQVAGNVVQARDIGQVAFSTPAPVPVRIPRQLPPAPRGFVNRISELDTLDRLLEEIDDGSMPVVAVISGLGGVGKSAVSRRWAHRVRDRFADGQLYADLGALRHHGGVEVSDVLGGFLRALGVHEEWIPADLLERAALFRSKTADLRLLILLDDVEHAAQVTPLLPASAAGAVVVTSHRRLGELIVTGATPIPVQPLGDDEGVRLLATMLGEERVNAEPEAARQLARLCGGLPVALRVCAARLVQRRTWPVSRLVDELADEHRRLERLAAGGATIVEAVFAVAYHALPPEAGRLYRLLGVVPVVDFSASLAEVAAGVGTEETERLLEILVEVNLLEETAQERYRFHDLVRLHAARVAERQEPVGEREAILHRVALWYLGRTMAADRAIMGDRLRLASRPQPIGPETVFASPGEALDWLESERVNTVALLRLAEQAGWDEIVWQTVEALWALYHNRKHYADWIETGKLGAVSAQRCGDQAVEARMRNQIARALIELGELDRASEELLLARRLAEAVDNQRMQAVVLESLGQADLAADAPEAAIEWFTAALTLNEAMGNPRGVGLQTYHLGLAYREANRLHDAAQAFERARAVMSEVDDELSQAKIGIELGLAYRKLGRLAEAMETMAWAAEVMRARRIPVKEGRAWEILSDLAADMGNDEAARDYLHRAIAACLASGNPTKAETLSRRLSTESP